MSMHDHPTFTVATEYVPGKTHQNQALRNCPIWFSNLGLPNTAQRGPSLWQASPDGRSMVIFDGTDVLVNGQIYEPLAFIAEVLEVSEEDAWLWAAGKKDVPSSSQFTSAASFEGRAIPPRRWLIEGIVPSANATLLAGDGGVGKSLLAMQMAVATASSQGWIGLEVSDPGPVIYLSAEDDVDELHRRFASILETYGLTFADVPDLYFRSMVGQGALLAERGREKMKPSMLAQEIEQFATKIGAKLTVLDTLANLYPGDENDRAQVTQFVDIVKGIGLRSDCTMLLLAHPSKSAMETGDGYSGNTAWNGAVRSRLYFEKHKVQGEMLDPDARVLRTMKSNYGPTGGEIALSYAGGVFVPSAAEGPLDKRAATAKAERVFIELLSEFTTQGRRVNSNGGTKYAPNLFASHPKSEGITKRAFRTAMEGLFTAGRIRQVESGPASRRSTYIEEVAK